MNLAALAQPNTDDRVPPLRDDLHIVPTYPSHDGGPTWTIIDPLRHRYFQIGWEPYQFLSRWHLGAIQPLLSAIEQETTRRFDRKDIEGLIAFLYANNLTRDPIQGSSKAYEAQARLQEQSWLMWLVHHYLFFKIPLVRPDAFLRATLPLVAPLFTPVARRLALLSAFAGLYLAGRQWNTFTDTFLYFFTAKGMAWYAVALCGIKLAHELGHAYTTTRFGCRVPTIGVAFLVMFPMLYTDTSEAWRLKSRAQRCLIGAAGMIVELSLAAAATLLWSFLEDGTLRSVAFVVATTSWVMGLSINLNPLMRFDGYYILSDWLGVPNLQDRAFALGTWQVRRILFGLNDPPPESCSPALRWKLILYAWSVWVYRLVLFTGIALLVYHFAFKALGVMLFAIEIGWFILMPIVRELKVWWTRRASIGRSPHPWIAAAILAAVTMALVVPWPTSVSIPAVVEARPHTRLFTPAPGRIVQATVHNGQTVAEGDILVTLEAPSVEKDVLVTQKRIEILELRARQQVGNQEELSKNMVVQQAYRTRLSELTGLYEKQDTLVLRSPISGIVMDVEASLHPGRWINEKLPLAFIVAPQEREIEALASETEIVRLTTGQDAVFVPDDPTQPTVAAEVRDIRQIDEGNFTLPYLASVFGGPVAVREDQKGALKPDMSVYRIRLSLSGPPPAWMQATRGQLHIHGHPVSVLERAGTHALAVLIRESGF